MKTGLWAAAAAVLLAACSQSGNPPVVASGAIGAAAQVVPVAARAGAPRAAGEIPAQITFASSVGDVTFHHEMHFKDLGARCVDCHHQIDAKALATPHAGYLENAPVNCKGCHGGAGKARDPEYTCSNCHPARPGNIADETLSAKVVIHSQCWKCHQVGTGREASATCVKCHSGGKSA